VCVCVHRFVCLFVDMREGVNLGLCACVRVCVWMCVCACVCECVCVRVRACYLNTWEGRSVSTAHAAFTPNISSTTWNANQAACVCVRV